MAARLGFFRPERRTKTVHLAESTDRGLGIELTALCQIGHFTEIIGFKESRGSFTSGRSENRSIDQSKSTLIEEITAGFYDCMANF